MNFYFNIKFSERLQKHLLSIYDICRMDLELINMIKDVIEDYLSTDGLNDIESIIAKSWKLSIYINLDLEEYKVKIVDCEYEIEHYMFIIVYEDIVNVIKLSEMMKKEEIINKDIFIDNWRKEIIENNEKIKQMDNVDSKLKDIYVINDKDFWCDSSD